MKYKKIIALLLATILVVANTSNIAFASNSIQDEEQFFEMVWFDDDGNIIQPRINADGTFTYSFVNRLHSRHFQATSDKISLSFITTSDSKAYYYIALYDVTDDPTNPSFKTMTQSQDDVNKADSKTFNVEKGRKYRLTFSKVNPMNDSQITGRGTIYGVK